MQYYYRHGVPFTLGYTVLNENHKFYNYVKPFPCIEDQVSELRSPCDSGSLINVVDLVMGQDGILWVLDIGISDTLGGKPSRGGDPKIVAFDLTTEKVKGQILIINNYLLITTLQKWLQYSVGKISSNTHCQCLQWYRVHISKTVCSTLDDCLADLKINFCVVTNINIYN